MMIGVGFCCKFMFSWLRLVLLCAARLCSVGYLISAASCYVHVTASVDFWCKCMCKWWLVLIFAACLCSIGYLISAESFSLCYFISAESVDVPIGYLIYAESFWFFWLLDLCWKFIFNWLLDFCCIFFFFFFFFIFFSCWWLVLIYVARLCSFDYC